MANPLRKTAIFFHYRIAENALPLRQVIRETQAVLWEQAEVETPKRLTRRDWWILSCCCR